MNVIDQLFELSDYQKNVIFISCIALLIATLAQGVKFGPITIPTLPSPFDVQSRVMAGISLLLFILLHARTNPENPLFSKSILAAILFFTVYLFTSILVYIFHPDVTFKRVNKISGIAALFVLILAIIPLSATNNKPEKDMTGLLDTLQTKTESSQPEEKLTQSDQLLKEIEKMLNDLRQRPNDEALIAEIEGYFLNDAEVVWYQNEVGFIQPDLNAFLSGIATRPYQIMVYKDKSQVAGNKIARIHLYGK